MKQHNQQRKYKSRIKPYDIEIQVSYVPYPSEQARRQAYCTYAKLFLKAKERMLSEEYRKVGNSRNYNNKKGRSSAPSY